MSESPKERVDREYGELLEEIRVALPGVEVIFAFLLTVPFSERFSHLTEVQKEAYFVALLAVAVACGLLLAPTAYHRLRFRANDKEWITRRGSVMALIAMLLIALGVSVTLFVVTDLTFGRTPALAVGISFGVLLLGLWYGVPLARRHESPPPEA